MSRADLDTEKADARRLAAVLLELSAITSRSPSGAGYAADHREVLYQQVKVMLQFVPVWWQITCSPWAAWRFAAMKKLLCDRDSFEIGEYRRLRGLFCRLRFGYVLDPFVVAMLDQHIATRRLTDRDAWRLTHSMGCRVLHGSVEPAPASAWVARVGCALSGGLAALFVASVVRAFSVWCDPSQSLCGFAGYAFLAYVTAHLSPFLLCLTWGRREAGTYLAFLLKEQGCAHDEPRKLMTSISRMAW